jgi:hypothetical protein
MACRVELAIMSSAVIRSVLIEGPATAAEIALETGFPKREAIIRCCYLNRRGQIERIACVDPDPEVRWSKRPILWALTPRGHAMARRDVRLTPPSPNPTQRID